MKKLIFHLVVGIGLMTAMVTVTWCLPLGRVNDRESYHRDVSEMVSIESGKNTQRLPIRGTGSETQRTELRENSDILVKRDGDYQERPRRQGRHRLNARANIDDDLTDEDLDAFRDEESTIDVKPERPTPSEIQTFLSPEEWTAFQAARQDLRLYRSAYKVIKEAKAEGREPTPKEREDFKNATRRIVAYQKLYRVGIKRLVQSGRARPEAVAYWNNYVEKSRAESKAWRDSLSEAGRQALRDRKSAHGRERRKARKARRKELEARVREDKATQQELRELAELRAESDRAKALTARRRANQSPEEREADKAKDKARKARVYAEKKAARKALEARLSDDTATAEDRQVWAQIQEEEQQAKAAKEAKKARLEELKEKVRNETATAEEERELADFEAKREHQRAISKAARQRRMQANTVEKDKSGETDIADPSGNSASTENKPPPQGTIDPSNSGPLQSSVSPPSSFAGVRIPSPVGDRLRDVQQGISAIPSITRTRLGQLGNFLQHLQRAVPMDTQNQNGNRYPILPVGGDIPVRARFAGH